MDRYLYDVYVATDKRDYRFYLYATSSSMAISTAVSACDSQSIVKVECKKVANALPTRQGA